MIDAANVRDRVFPMLRQSYGAKDAILYALALGYGSDPIDEEQLRYVYERELRIVPTFANVLCHPGFWVGDPDTGIDASRVVHGEHRMHWHAPLPTCGTVVAQNRVIDVIDKGIGKGALVVSERLLRDDANGMLLARIEQHTLCRGDGGFSASATFAKAPNSVVPVAAMESEPRHMVDIQVLPQAALLYRQSADLNPLHADPRAAKAGGFARPILHGLATFGIVCRAVLQACADNDANRLRSLGGRFSAPVYPGDVLRTEIWRGEVTDGVQSLHLRCSVPERQITVFTNASATVLQSGLPLA